jgi:hypothetical protein
VESHFLHVRNWWKVAFLILLGFGWNFCWVESHVSHIVGSRLEAHVSHIVRSRVEGHFLILLGVVGRKTKFPILLGVAVGGESPSSHIVGNRSKFAHKFCRESLESRVSHIVGSYVKGSLFACWEFKVAFLILLGVESHDSHIVGSRLEAHVSHLVWSQARTVAS